MNCFWKKCAIFFIWGCLREFYHRFMYIAPSSDQTCYPSICLLKWLYLGGLRLFSDVWIANAALFKRLMKIHSNPPTTLALSSKLEWHRSLSQLQSFMRLSSSRYRKYTVFLRRKPRTNKLPAPIQIHWVEKLKVPYKWRILSWWHIPNELWCAM